MIFGEYPCCGEALTIELPEKVPSFAPEQCPHCGAKIWHYFSRFDPKSYTEAEFLNLYLVDDHTKTITLRSERPM